MAKTARGRGRKGVRKAVKKAIGRVAGAVKKARAAKRAKAAKRTKRAEPAAISFVGNAVMRGGRRLLTVAPGLESLVASSPALSKMTEQLTELVTVTVAPKTFSQERIQDQRGKLSDRRIDDFRPRPDAKALAAERLKQLGFSIRREGRFAITVTGPARLVSEVLKVQLALQARPQRVLFRATQNFAASFAPPSPDDLFVAPTQSLTVRSTVSEHIDDFIFIPPPHFFALSPTPPTHAWHGVTDAKIRQLLNVPAGATGRGVKVGIVDTGFFQHPYYANSGFDYQPTPTTSAPNPTNDSNGHGTAIAFNVFAAAPAATVLGFAHTDPPQDALEEAADAGVDIISCSWGWPHEQSFPTLEATIRSIVNEGKIVLFASGNGQHAWPGSMPEIVSIGGVFANAANELEASNYASGFTSDLYPNRKVPDVCGLVGEKPRGIYIMMPCPPGCEMDREFAGKPFPDSDETKTSDGWVGASGTSSATPQIAGVAALLVERARVVGRTLTSADLRQILQSTAVPVQKGNNAQGFPAVGHPNVAVGHGLVNAAAALAKV
jgi:hypothetical protein